MADDKDCFSVNILLGRVRNDAQLDRLKEVGYWLDQNKFSCTLSVIDGVAMFDIEPHEDQKQLINWPYDEYRLYVAELVIHALAVELSHNDH
jgi:hypothetical protein